MGDKTGIPWTDASWNYITGCIPKSEGCKYCYAFLMAQRLKNIEYSGYKDGFNITIHEDKLDLPLRWTRPRMIFVSSMGDFFHENVPYINQKKAFDVMIKANHHIYQILTKRPENVLAFWDRFSEENKNEQGLFLWPPHIWFGITAENQQRYNERLPILLKIPSMVRFISMEPLLDNINLFDNDIDKQVWDFKYMYYFFPEIYVTTRQIDWVIVGGESGKFARPMDEEWVRNIRNQCSKAYIPFFYKQKIENGKKIKMPLLDGKRWEQFPFDIPPQYPFALDEMNEKTKIVYEQWKKQIMAGLYK